MFSTFFTSVKTTLKTAALQVLDSTLAEIDARQSGNPGGKENKSPSGTKERVDVKTKSAQTRKERTSPKPKTPKRFVLPEHENDDFGPMTSTPIVATHKKPRRSHQLPRAIASPVVVKEPSPSKDITIPPEQVGWDDADMSTNIFTGDTSVDSVQPSPSETVKAPIDQVVQSTAGVADVPVDENDIGNILPSKQRSEKLACKLCSRKPLSEFARDLVIHMSVHESTLLRYQCGMCPFKNASHLKVAMHVKRIHKDDEEAHPKDLMTPEMKGFILETSAKCFPDNIAVIEEWCGVNEFERNLKKEEQNESGCSSDATPMKKKSVADNRTKIACEVCETLQMKAHVRLLTHAITHIIQKPFQCSQCGTQFINQNTAVAHLTNIHKEAHLIENRSSKFQTQLRTSVEKSFPKIATQLLENWERIYNGKKIIDEKQKKFLEEDAKKQQEEKEMGEALAREAEAVKDSTSSCAPVHNPYASQSFSIPIVNNNSHLITPIPPPLWPDITKGRCQELALRRMREDLEKTARKSNKTSFLKGTTPRVRRTSPASNFNRVLPESLRRDSHNASR